MKDIVEALIACTRISESTLKWAESRKEALHSLTMILQTLGIDEAGKYIRLFRDITTCHYDTIVTQKACSSKKLMHLEYEL